MDFYKEGNASQRPRPPAKNNHLNTCSQKIVQMYLFIIQQQPQSWRAVCCIECYNSPYRWRYASELSTPHTCALMRMEEGATAGLQ